MTESRSSLHTKMHIGYTAKDKKYLMQDNTV